MFTYIGNILIQWQQPWIYAKLGSYFNLLTQLDSYNNNNFS